MIDFIREAGYGIWGVLVAGSLATALAARYAMRPDDRLVPRIRVASMATMVLGVLGTVIGVQTSARYLYEVGPEEKWIFAVGLMESLNNLVAALLILLVVLALSYVGIHRAARRPAGTAARGHIRQPG